MQVPKTPKLRVESVAMGKQANEKNELLVMIWNLCYTIVKLK